MPNYRAYLTRSQYAAFEFEADNDELAWDHMETLVSNYRNENDRLMARCEESGEDTINIDEIEEI